MAPPPFERAVSYGPYQGRMREAIHALKYEGLRALTGSLGGMLAIAIARLQADMPDELLVVPVPLHRSKYAQRGFNQARALAQAALDELSRAHPLWRLHLAPEALLRQRATPSQAGLTPRQRRMNMKDAFAVRDAGRVAGAHVLLIDDILTTGATARSAAKALLGAGAASVRVATLARAYRVADTRYDAGLKEFETNPAHAPRDFFASVFSSAPGSTGSGLLHEELHDSSHHQSSF